MNGQVMNSDTVENSWLERTVDLSPFAGKTAIKMWITTDAATPPGPAWDNYYSDIAIYSTDGTVTPIYYRQNSIGLSYFSGGSISNPQASVQVSNSAGDAELPANTTTYYLSDQIGSARMLAAAGGWPVSMDIYYPFGQEQSAPADNNHYKFTGKERDSETGFDYFGARYYASGMGRWLSPDYSDGPEAVPFADLNNPQSLNLYAYVQDNPLGTTDPDGHHTEGCSTSSSWSGDTLYVTVLCQALPQVDRVHHNSSLWHRFLVWDGYYDPVLRRDQRLFFTPLFKLPAPDPRLSLGIVFPLATDVGGLGSEDLFGTSEDASEPTTKPTPLQTGGNTITNRIAEGLNKGTGENLTRREWGRALEALKRDNGLSNNVHGQIMSNADFVVNGETVGNIRDYIP